jgi:hypothetical protein
MDPSGYNPEDCERAVMMSIFLNHHFGSFHHGGDGIALFELEFVGASARDRAIDQIVSDSNRDEGHHVAQLNLFDCSAQFVSG